MSKGLHVLDAFTDPTTGHHTFHIRVVETNGQDTFEGPVRTVGIDAQALIDLHGNDPEKFILSHKPDMVRIHDAVRAAVEPVHSLKGKTL